MQPTYLPWAGYFNLIASVDEFVFLDDVQLQKNSWQGRNRILLNHEPHWLTVPVKHASLDQLINNTLLCEEKKWRRKHVMTLKNTYARHPYKVAVTEIAEYLINNNATNLATLNANLICYIASRLNISTPVRLSSEIGVTGKRTDKLLNILQVLQAKIYVSPVGASGYLQEDGFSLRSNIDLQFQAYLPLPYSQHGHKSFLPYLSIVDVIANLGWLGASEYVKNNQKE